MCACMYSYIFPIPSTQLGAIKGTCKYEMQNFKSNHVMMSVTIHFYISDHILIITGFLKLILIKIIPKIVFKTSDLMAIKIQTDLCILLLLFGNNVGLVVYNDVINCV